MTYDRILRLLLDAGHSYVDADRLAREILAPRDTPFAGTKSIDWHLDINEWSRHDPRA